MKYRLKVRPEAESDLSEAKHWYNKRRPALGKEFLAAVRRTIHRIRRDPLLFAVVYRETRCTLVSRFPYVVYFRIHGDLISVIAVLHGHRDESLWQSRAKNGD
jgi:plasmid stabilization system protein ParE